MRSSIICGIDEQKREEARKTGQSGITCTGIGFDSISASLTMKSSIKRLGRQTFPCRVKELSQQYQSPKGS